VKSEVKDLALAPSGQMRIEWADRNMPVLRHIRERFAKERPLKGVKIGACLHVTSETANLARALKAGGAEVALCASNPLSTQDDVAASLVKDFGISVFAIKGEENKTYYRHINAVLDTKPVITMDDGADLVSVLHSKKRDLLSGIVGGTSITQVRDDVYLIDVVARARADERGSIDMLTTASANWICSRTIGCCGSHSVSPVIESFGPITPTMSPA